VKIAYAAAATVLLAGVSLALTSWGGPVATVSWSLLVGLLSVLLLRLIRDPEDQRSDGASMLMAGSAAVLAWVLRWVWIGLPDRETVWYDAAAVIAALGVAWGTELLLAGRSSKRCFICKTQIQERRPMACPRCHEVICTQPSCWISRHLRCRYCDEREVVLFPMRDETWWRTRLGGRVSTGSCGSCFEEAGAADLRACPECSWPMCKRCWDYHNGRCVRCEALMPGLPDVLRPFFTASGPRRGAHDAFDRRSV
jgi:hypothetical protein